VIEVASLGTKRIDYGIKLFKYRSSGVREYWIVNPLTQTVNVYDLEGEELSDQYTFDDDIPNMDNVKSISYQSSNKKVASVSKKGTIKTNRKGTATVRVTVSLNNGKKKVFECG